MPALRPGSAGATPAPLPRPGGRTPAPEPGSDADRPAPHPRTIGWIGTAALAMGGSNQSLFLIGALIAGQGSAAVPLLIAGLLLSWAAAPGWTELVLMWPNRVGGIAATCAEAFRPYSPVLANLTGVCYWWGWVPTCGLTALLSATAISEWYLPNVSVPALAIALILVFLLVNLCGVKWVTRLAIPIATASAALAFLSGLVPLLSGHVDWRQAATFQLHSPFPGAFGGLTSAMAGLYLIGFAAPAFEAAACHVGETINPARNVPRAMLASGLMAFLYFAVLPVLWLGVLGPLPLMGDLAQALGPTFAPLLGGAARAAAIWFMMFNMFHGTLQPLAGAARTLAQLAEDGLLPRVLAWRSRTDVPWVATLLTAAMAIAFLLTGDPTWVIAAANLAYLIGIGLPSVAVWLLRRNAPAMARPYRAPRGTIGLGLAAAGVWGLSTVLGFEQFGLPTVLAGLALTFTGPALYALRRWLDRRRSGVRGVARSLHLKLTGAMLLVLGLDAAGYLLAVGSVSAQQTARIAALEDIFVAVAILTISVGLILPGMIGHAAGEVARAADGLATGTLADLLRAMEALGAGNLDAAHARVSPAPVAVRTRDEVGAMAASFNVMQAEVAQAARALDSAREGLQRVLRDRAEARASELVLREANRRMDEFLSIASHELRTPLTTVKGYVQLVERRLQELADSAPAADVAAHVAPLHGLLTRADDHIRRLTRLMDDLLDVSRIHANKLELRPAPCDLLDVVYGAVQEQRQLSPARTIDLDAPATRSGSLLAHADADRIGQVVTNYVTNALKYSPADRPVVVGVGVDGAMARVWVRDEGPGLPLQEQRHIWERFYRVDGIEPRSGSHVGLGLGLHICRTIVEQHQGQVGVQSAPGMGATFWFSLPLVSADDAAGSDRQPDAVHGSCTGQAM